MKKKLLAELARAEGEHPEHVSHTGSIRTVIAFLEQADKQEHLPDFLSFSDASDRAFGDSWRQACPELTRHLEPREIAGWIRGFGLAS